MSNSCNFSVQIVLFYNNFTRFSKRIDNFEIEIAFESLSPQFGGIDAE